MILVIEDDEDIRRFFYSLFLFIRKEVEIVSDSAGVLQSNMSFNQRLYLSMCYWGKRPEEICASKSNHNILKSRLYCYRLHQIACSTISDIMQMIYSQTFGY